MTPAASTASLTFREVFLRWSREHWMGFVIALLSLAVVAVLQISLLSAWHFAMPDAQLRLKPANEAVEADSKEKTLTYSFVGGSAVSVTEALNLSTDSVLALDVSLDGVPQRTVLTLGWAGTRDRARPSDLAIALPASFTPRTYRIVLRGNKEWRDNLTQLAVALTAPAGSEPVTLLNAEFVSATPWAASQIAISHWFSDRMQLKPNGSVLRVLPFAAFLGLAALIACAFIVGLKRNDSRARRDALIGAGAIYTLGALVVAIATATPFVLSFAALPWLLAVCSVACGVFRLPTLANRGGAFSLPLHTVLSLAAAALATFIGGWVFAWTILVALWAFISQRFDKLAAKLQPFAFFLPPLAIAGLLQAANAKYLELPARYLIDPSSALGNAAHTASAVPGIAIALMLLQWAWPRSTFRTHDTYAGIALWLTAIGSLATFIMMNAERIPSASFGWVLLPSIVALIAWLAPKFLSRVEETAPISVQEKTEADLSAVVRQLFDGASASFDAVVASDHPGGAIAPLKRMREIAAASTITRSAEIRYALVNNELASARNAYSLLKNTPRDSLDAKTNESLLEYAYRTDDYEGLLPLATALEPSERRSRLIAHAQLLGTQSDDRAALETLQSAPKPNSLALEIVELCLLRDDWQAAQQALAESTVSPQSKLGEVYIARLGYRATQQSAYADQIQKLVTWNNTLAAAQAAMGELLLAQGNSQGARARFLVAVKSDPLFWPLKWRIQQIDRGPTDTTSAIDHAQLAVQS